MCLIDHRFTLLYVMRPQIHALVRDEDFVRNMNDIERGTWFSFVEVMDNFLGYKKKANNYETLVTNLLSDFLDLRCNMNAKLYFLYSHLDRFPENFRAINDDQGERFHQSLMIIDECYQGSWDEHMIAGYCWNKIALRQSTNERGTSTNSCMTTM